MKNFFSFTACWNWKNGKKSFRSVREFKKKSFFLLLFNVFNGWDVKFTFDSKGFNLFGFFQYVSFYWLSLFTELTWVE
jgi:hypothetical protein